MIGGYTVILKVTTLVAVAALAGCGGSNDGSATNPTTDTPTTDTPTTDTTASAVVLDEFADGGGIARVSTTADGQTIVQTLIASDIVAGTNEINANGLPQTAVDLAGLTFDGSNQYGDFYSGNITINGITTFVDVYADSRTNVFAIGGLQEGEVYASLIGDAPSNIPSGSFIYNGTNFTSYRNGDFPEVGTFTMNVDFSAGTAALAGSTNTTTIGGTGIVVNTSNGTFTDGPNTVLTFTDSGFQKTYDALIDGSFHGSGATGVTGIYTDAGGTPEIVGLIAGSR
jgi:hypothetical protein